MFMNGWLAHIHRDVLGYATDMSVQSLLEGTNAQRVANGESGLGLNGQLNQAAQTKANDMAARNYWSHNTPDGQTPWTFFTAAGYSYQKAGENLAYGFATSSDTITGWMNSPEHRANILNASYQEVGFGIVNIPDYQNSGPQTLVVAMYAQPTTVVASSPAPVASAKPTPQKATTAQPITTATPEAPAAEPVPAPVATVAPTPVATKKSDTLVAAKTRDSIDEQRVARIQLFTAGNASWSLFAVTLLGTCALFIFLFNHAIAWHKVLVRGERFVLHHPLLDIAFIGLATFGFLLSQTSGLIR
jgi:cell division septation protein DedD